MNKKIKQKFILVIDNNFSKLNELLEDSCQSRCHVLLRKEVYE